MSASLDERLSALRLARLAVWVYDHEQRRFQWANAMAAELWRATSVEELLSRDLSDLSEGTRTRLDHYMEAIKDGREVSEDWTLYPRGVPTSMILHASRIELDDGRLAILFQATAKKEQTPASTLRGVEALHHTSLLVSLVTPEGQSLFHNPAVLRTFGDAPSILGWFQDDGAQFLQDLAAGRTYLSEEPMRTLFGERWHTLEARPTVDPVSGAPAVLLQQLDVHGRREAEELVENKSKLVDQLNHSLRLVEEQRQQILTLSAPILEIGKHTIAIALIGALGVERFDEISERLLPAIQTYSARYVILDFTGCSELLSGGAQGFERISNATVLLGALPVITGIRPSLARPLSLAGLSFSGRVVLRTLREGIEYCRSHANDPHH